MQKKELGDAIDGNPNHRSEKVEVTADGKIVKKIRSTAEYKKSGNLVLGPNDDLVSYETLTQAKSASSLLLFVCLFFYFI